MSTVLLSILIGLFSVAACCLVQISRVVSKETVEDYLSQMFCCHYF